MREVYYSTLKKFFNELNYRKALSEAELNKQPFLLVVFGNACRFFADNEFESFRDRYRENFSCFVAGSTYPETAKELLQKDIPDWLIDGRRTDTFLFQNKDNRVQIQTYHLPLGIGLR